MRCAEISIPILTLSAAAAGRDEKDASAAATATTVANTSRRENAHIAGIAHSALAEFNDTIFPRLGQALHSEAVCTPSSSSSGRGFDQDQTELAKNIVVSCLTSV